MKIVIVHYHFFPGGVTSAVRSSLVALSQSGYLNNREIVLLCGHKRGTEELKKSLADASINAEINVHPELFYRQEIWPGERDFEKEAGELCELLLGYGRGGTIYWVHNPTIGKNPALTRALILAAEKADNQNMPLCFLYHVHDFPECGRPNNLKYLLNCHEDGGLRSLYPDTGNVAFICINSSDEELLLNSGVPRSRVFFLPNAIEVKKDAKPLIPIDKVRSALEEYAKRHGYVFHREKPFWLMPIRLIRRKNALEAFFLRVLNQEAQVLITLDANSEPEYPYANAVKDAIRREKAPGMVGFGAELVGKVFSFDELISTSRAIVTTSLMEGFGFAFIEGPIRGKPLLGRNLPHVTKDFGQLGLPLDDLYKRFLVPVPRVTRTRLNHKFTQFARGYAAMAGIDSDLLESYIYRVNRMYEDEAVDFGFLDLETQLELFPRLKDEKFREDVRLLNSIELKFSKAPRDFVERVEDVFGFRAHAEKLSSIFKKVTSLDPEVKMPPKLGQKLREAFFVPERNRPLFW